MQDDTVDWEGKITVSSQFMAVLYSTVGPRAYINTNSWTATVDEKRKITSAMYSLLSSRSFTSDAPCKGTESLKLVSFLGLTTVK